MTAALLAAASSSARAIECDEDYQIVQGQPVSTPYCRDNYLAAVARTYGFKYSDSTVRNNPARKEEICRFIGSDIRVHTACEEVLPGSSDTR
ncbi:hypothetical protein [Hyphomicrobium sp. 99]|uniref:hypothetical protein n=1 Tax=Hyphomicrobium sp. 99 TaxID=1163419 RepID=UPI001FD96E87|nr:hypothetical protein [Hyphomicrobium sp. 99]